MQLPNKFWSSTHSAFSAIATTSFAIAGCLETTDYRGTGPIDLTREAQQYYNEWLEAASPMSFFITADGLGIYYTTCPDPNNACRGGGQGVGAGIRKCENLYGRACYLYGQNGKVVWQRDAPSPTVE